MICISSILFIAKRLTTSNFKKFVTSLSEDIEKYPKYRVIQSDGELTFVPERAAKQETSFLFERIPIGMFHGNQLILLEQVTGKVFIFHYVNSIQQKYSAIQMTFFDLFDCSFTNRNFTIGKMATGNSSWWKTVGAIFVIAILAVLLFFACR